MNKMQRRFCKEYLLDLNATQAALRTGYSKKTAYSQGQRLLKHDEVQAEVQRLMDIRADKTEINADYVLTGIKETIEDAAQTIEAEDKPPIMVNHNAALKGYELLGKHLKLFTEKHEHSGNVGVSLQFVANIQRDKQKQ